ncbi:MAG: site-2 protease family protein [Bacillota bacterium]|jgi:Zn-dependent protease|nr:site-2 protease family protein [Bacillota bacterium]HOC06359.1 site-2 protease family protein [Bacillota bacterium]HPZ21774.1 site-2 protease family protein [Bacillota bacterium]HQD19180.1 site-2 protease family protein [Bacillota bacterium]
MNILQQIVRDLIYWVPALVIAMSFHEYAHARVADRLGDPTPRYAGRLTINPLKHVDPIGLLMLVIVRFGWAKPVPVNPLYFRGDRRQGMIEVSLAGPATNFVLAVLAGIAMAFAAYWSQKWPGAVHILRFLDYLLIYNVFFGVFNLMPIPPLDGSKILFNLLPQRYYYIYLTLEQYGPFILILVLVTGLHHLFLTPIASGLIKSIMALANEILKILVKL